MKRWCACLCTGIAVLFAAVMYCISNPYPKTDVLQYSFILENTVQLQRKTEEAERKKRQLTGQLNAIGACLMDADTGRVLYEKNGDQQMPMASTTKIMTCLLALENCTMDEVVTISAHAASMPDVQLNAKKGEQYTMRDLLHSMMMESHNDSAAAVAEHIAGSEEAFCSMMTERAKELGAESTNYQTANGLDGDEHYTTPVDLARIAAYAIKQEAFCRIVSCPTYQVTELHGKRSVFLANIDKYLYMDSQALGIKTGFTGKAGYCFVGATRYEGTILISVVLGSGWPPHKTYKWMDTKKLVQYGRENFTKQELSIAQAELGKLPVLGGVQEGISVGIPEGFQQKLLLGNEEVQLCYVLPKALSAPVQKGDIVGEAELLINGRLYESVPICAEESVERFDYQYCLRGLLSYLRAF